MSVDHLVARFQEEQRRANESVKVLSVALHERNARIKALRKRMRSISQIASRLLSGDAPARWEAGDMLDIRALAGKEESGG